MRKIFIQASSFCNIDCKYCYVAAREDKSTLSIDNLQRVKKLIQHINKPVEIVWHNGEPLSIGVEYYQKAIDILRLTGVSFRMVTNGILLNQKWFTFLNQNQIKLTISSDGPQLTNDENRLTRSQSSIYSLLNAKLLDAVNQKICDSVLCTVSKKSCGHGSEIYDYFKKIGPPILGFNMEAPFDHDQSRVPKKHEATQFWRELHHHWKEDDHNLFIRNFYKILKMESGNFRPKLDEFKRLENLSITKNGSVYSQLPEVGAIKNKKLKSYFYLGHLKTLVSCKRIKPPLILREMEKSRQLCKSECDFFNYCGGGFTLDKLLQNETLASTETTSCINSVKSLVSAFT